MSPAFGIARRVCDCGCGSTSIYNIYIYMYVQLMHACTRTHTCTHTHRQRQAPGLPSKVQVLVVTVWADLLGRNVGVNPSCMSQGPKGMLRHFWRGACKILATKLHWTRVVFSFRYRWRFADTPRFKELVIGLLLQGCSEKADVPTMTAFSLPRVKNGFNGSLLFGPCCLVSC